MRRVSHCSRFPCGSFNRPVYWRGTGGKWSARSTTISHDVGSSDPALMLFDSTRYWYSGAGSLRQSRAIRAGEPATCRPETGKWRGFGVRHRLNGVCVDTQSEPRGNRCKPLTQIKPSK